MVDIKQNMQSLNALFNHAEGNLFILEAFSLTIL